MKKVLAIVICLGFTSYAAAEIDFDRAIDIEEAIESSSEHSFDIPNVRWDGDSWYTEQYYEYLVYSLDTDCTFEKTRFFSQEWIQNCYTDYAFDTGTHCSDIRGRSWSLNGQLIIKQRELYPWEKETFHIYIHGPKLDLRLIDTVYKYSIERVEGGGETIFTLTPKSREAGKPDMYGIEIVHFAYSKEAKKYVLKLKDVWAKDYAGEKIEIYAELWKDAFLWPDSAKETKRIEFEVSDNYEIFFDNNEIDKAYVKWGFTRIGKISTEDYMNRGETYKVSK
ncbi:MAG: hypothetical protein KAQ76_01210 [Elusimicrobiales bacterium]|nr:hypothetical protein [Elusimicrobiales bacterium]